jgi:acyl-CoA reductase-like NAD-dependent aldehyde dehydrogenase
MDAGTGPSPRYDAKLLINGELIDSPERIEVTNPARPAQIVGSIVRGRPQDVDAAVQAAQTAQRRWASKTYKERAAFLAQGLDFLGTEIEARALCYVRENGKTLGEARSELAGLPARQKIALSYAEELDAGRHLTMPNGRSQILYRPYGVVVSIVPWNSPVSLAFSQIVAALLAGNAVVLKPPETCPLTLILSVEIFARALPPGLVNIVTGLPGEIGDALTTHPGVGKIGFTGSIASARHIMANAAQTIKGVTLELGGNDPALVLKDADLSEKSIRTMAAAAYRMTGQVCMAIKRFYVPGAMADQFTELFTKAVGALVVGDGVEPEVTMGPLHTRRALERAQALVEEAERGGGQVAACGQVHDAGVFADGYFMRPTVVFKPREDARLVTEEQFCPAVPILTYDDRDEVLARMNDTVYGLSASIWSSDTERAMQLASRIAAGQVWINAHGTQATNHLAPYGGVKQSGIGRKSGFEGVLEYMQSQTVTAWEDDAVT